jgi:hypothetical protein
MPRWMIRTTSLWDEKLMGLRFSNLTLSLMALPIRVHRRMTPYFGNDTRNDLQICRQACQALTAGSFSSTDLLRSGESGTGYSPLKQA